MSLYYACLTFTGQDIGPQTDWQIAFITVCIVLGEMINANIFAEMAVVLAGMNRKNTVYQEKVDIANSQMKIMKINEKLQMDVIEYLSFS